MNNERQECMLDRPVIIANKIIDMMMKENISIPEGLCAMSMILLREFGDAETAYERLIELEEIMLEHEFEGEKHE